MTARTNRAVPLIAVVEGYSVDSAVAAHGAETFTVKGMEEARLALTYADGIILTGGGDVDPSRYGQKKHQEVYGIDAARDKLEFWLVKKARQRGIPIMGICRGSQVINIAHGGTLHQDIYDQKGVADHWGTTLWVKLSRKSRLARSIGSLTMRSSHYHHQSVAKMGRGLRAIAWAHDGTIEAIESAPGNPHYSLGVQFHPEMDYHHDKDAFAVFNHFVWAIAARFSHRRKQSATQRLASVRLLRPAPKYSYAGEYGGWPKSGSSSSYSMDSYLTGGKDEWEYEEWLALNTRAGMQESDDLEGLCDFPPCVSPNECPKYGDCLGSIVANRESLRTEHVQWQSADARAIAEGKRGNVRGGRL